MSTAFIVRLRPSGPWRLGPDSGARDHVDRVLHSDQLYSAVSWAMAQMGMLDAWLEATFKDSRGPAVRFSSCFPFQDELLFVAPPRSLWPPLASTKVRWKGSRFVPLQLVRALVAEESLDEDRWLVDGSSECLLPVERPRGPFRPAVRSNAAVDRISGDVAVHTTCCLEFNQGAGMWALATFADQEASERWSDPLRSAFCLLADSGIGGRRSLGWGRSDAPEFSEGILPDLILPAPAPVSQPEDEELQPVPETVYWLLSVYSPSQDDSVDWRKGNYSLQTRGGRVESPASRGELKKLTRVVTEGSVLFADAPLCGAAHDVAPDGFPHPVYRAGFALTIPIPWRVTS